MRRLVCTRVTWRGLVVGESIVVSIVRWLRETHNVFGTEKKEEYIFAHLTRFFCYCVIILVPVFFVYFVCFLVSEVLWGERENEVVACEQRI